MVKKPKRKLTPQQEAFAQAVMMGNTDAQAYRIAYPKSLGWKDNTLYRQAYQSAHHPLIMARIAELKEKLVNRELWTREQSVKVLAAIAGNGERDGDRVRAVAELNEMHGYNQPKKLDISATVQRIELVALVK